MIGILEPAPKTRAVPSNSDEEYIALTSKVRDDDPLALEDMKRIFGGGIHFFLNRAGVPVSGQNTLVNECLSVLQNRIKIDSSFNSSDVPKYLLAIVKSLIARSDAFAFKSAQVEKAKFALSQLSDQGKDAVVSYFVEGQTQSEICNRLGITSSKFQHYTSDAKVAFSHASHNFGEGFGSNSHFLA